MSKVWSFGKGWVDTDTDRLPADIPRTIPTDMPAGLQQQGVERHLPSHWVLAVYGIPQGESSIRRALCRLLKTHGLQSIDRGGSVYLGPENHGMDRELRQLVEKLRARTGSTDLVKIFVGDYDGITAAVFTEAVTKNALEDLKDAEALLAELERALAGEIVLKNHEGKELNLVTTGYGRIDSAKKAMEEVDSLLVRFNGTRELEAEGNRLRTRLAQIGAWVARIEPSYQRFAANERARQKEGVA